MSSLLAFSKARSSNLNRIRCCSDLHLQVVSTTGWPLEILLAYELKCQSVQEPLSINFRNFSTFWLRSIKTSNLWSFLGCPEPGELEPQIDLIAQLLLGLVKQLSASSTRPGIP